MKKCPLCLTEEFIINTRENCLLCWRCSVNGCLMGSLFRSVMYMGHKYFATCPQNWVRRGRASCCSHTYSLTCRRTSSWSSHKMVHIIAQYRCLELIRCSLFLLRRLYMTVQYFILLVGQSKRTCLLMLTLFVWTL